MIYFLHSNAMNAVKIGTTGNLKSRLGAYRTSNPEELLLLGSMEGGTKEEKTLHQKFAHLRMQGEWFQCTAELMIYIDDLLGGVLWEQTFFLRTDEDCFSYSDVEPPAF